MRAVSGRRWVFIGGLLGLTAVAVLWLQPETVPFPEVGVEPPPPEAHALEAHAAPQVPATVAGARLSGRVVGADGGVPGARVVLRGAGTTATQSDGAGRFSFDGLSAGEVFVSASLKTFASRVNGPWVLGPASAIDGVELRLEPASVLEGVVIDAASREPLPGAVITSSAGGTVADAKGRFRLEGLPAAAWVEASAAEHATRLEWLSAAEPRRYTEFVLALEPSAVVRGRVLRMGVPQANAAVWAERLAGPKTGATCGPVRADGDGGYRLECAPGVVQLQGALIDGSQARGPRLHLTSVPPGVVADLEVGEALAQTGRVTREGMPLAGVVLTAIDAATNALAGTAVSDAEGQFRFPHLPVGRYLVQANAQVLAAQVGPFEQTGLSAPWEVVLEPGRVLFGRVEPKAAGVQVRWRSGLWVGAPALGITDAEGRFRFEGVPAGELSIEAEGESGAASAKAAAGTEVVLRLGKGRLVVQVVDEIGRAVTDSTVSLVSERGGLTRRTSALTTTGRFELSLPPGGWQVSVDAEGYGASPAKRVEVGEGQVSLRVVLTSGRPLEGRVVDARSKAPVPGARVRVLSVPEGSPGVWQGGRTRLVLTDGGGGFRFASVAFPVLIAADAEQGGLGGWLELKSAPGSPVTLELQPAHGKPSEFMEYEGIGMRLAQGPGGRIVAAEVYAASPAERAGLLAGDVLEQVDGAPVGQNVEQAVRRILGPSGTAVRLGVRRGEQVFEVTLRRRTIAL